MAGSEFTYKGKRITWESGYGEPNYILTIYDKKGRAIEFKYYNEKDRKKYEQKVKKYIDEHLDEIE